MTQKEFTNFDASVLSDKAFEVWGVSDNGLYDIVCDIPINDINRLNECLENIYDLAFTD